MNKSGWKNLKTIFLITLMVSLLGATTALAYRGMGGGGMGKRWMMNLTPEQAGQVFDLKQQFMNDTAELRKGMLVKRAELTQLWKAEQPDEKAIQAKVKELGVLKTQFMEKAVAQRLALKKIFPAMGMGPCPMMGPGKGPGSMMHPGMCPYGQGNCPALGQGPDKGPGAGAGLMPGSDEVADLADPQDLEMAANPEAGW
ncbi:MAG: periplasmic heavy metal sensor [Desulfobaccales bacterium]